MRWFLDLSMRAKLLVSFGLMILFLLAIAATAYLGIKSIQESEKNLFEKDFANVVDLYTFEANLNRARADTLTMTILTDVKEQQKIHDDIVHYSKESDNLGANLRKRNEKDEKTKEKLEELVKIRDEFK